MQSIQLLNMLEAARNRANNMARLVAETKAQHSAAVKNSMIATAKRLNGQLKRQEMSLALANEEVREIEAGLAREGDLLTDKTGNKKEK